MDRLLVGILGLLLVVCVSADYNVWPYPKEVHSTENFFEINPSSFSFDFKPNGDCEVLETAIKRYRYKSFVQNCSLLNNSGRKLQKGKHDFTSNAHFKGKMNNLEILVENKCEKWPHVNMDETYTIQINEKEHTLRSKSVWGALRGLETFSQMVEHVGENQFTIKQGSVNDAPRFAHRGFMLDSSRHFLTNGSIFQTLDAMEHNKFNVFHWHLVDDQSFPYVSQVFPELSNKGAYNNETHVYQPNDVYNIIEYARMRGIRVIPEFDTPGHTQSWGKGQPNLLAQCYHDGKPNGQHGPIDPTHEPNYEFIRKLFAELIKVFPDSYTHLGGDEVDFSCWRSNPIIANFMKQHKIVGNYAKLEEYYIQKLVDIVHDLKKSYIVWQEVFDNGVNIKNDTLVHVWKARNNWPSEVLKVTSRGYHALLSSCWYLNVISYGTDWHQYYQCDPHAFNGTAQQKSMVIGGEACMWGEWVDSSNLISRSWPRASAVAERLWSPESMKDPGQASSRFHAQHCRMQKLGIRGEPIEGPSHCECDYAL